MAVGPIGVKIDVGVGVPGVAVRVVVGVRVTSVPRTVGVAVGARVLVARRVEVGLGVSVGGTGVAVGWVGVGKTVPGPGVTEGTGFSRILWMATGVPNIASSLRASSMIRTSSGINPAAAGSTP